MGTILRGEEAIKKRQSLIASGNLLGEFVVGSQAYGTATETSDEDLCFVYIEPLESLLTGTASEKLEITKDYNGYEIGRFLEMLGTNNPNILDLTKPASDTIKFIHPLYEKYITSNPTKFLTKKVKDSYGHYAYNQIRKAKGENKKFMNPIPKERKTLLDFCWVTSNQGSKPLKEALEYFGINIEACGCTNIPHMKNCFNLFVDKNYNEWIENLDENYSLETDGFCSPQYKGIIDKDGVQIKLSSIPKNELPFIMFYANYEGFSSYCKEYKEYWDFMENHNPDRFVLDEDGGYNSKNVAHCHRLLDMAIEILRDGELNIRRPNRDYLLQIRAGKFKYNDLIEEANKKRELIEELVKTSQLPEELNNTSMYLLQLRFRKEFYKLLPEKVQLEVY